MIEVGEYVRLERNQGIRKIEEIDKEIYLLDNEIANEWGEIVDYIYIDEEKNEIVKHSKNLIDLIEARRLCKWRKSCRSI